MERPASRLEARVRRGAVEGVVATAAMTAVFGAAERLGAVVKQPPDQVVEEATRKVGTTPPGPPAKGVLVWTAHFAFGAAMGAVFHLLRPEPRRPVAEGVAFAVALWAVSYQGFLPAARLFPPAARDDLRRQGVNLLAHGVYGIALGRSRRARRDASSP